MIFESLEEGELQVDLYEDQVFRITACDPDHYTGPQAVEIYFDISDLIKIKDYLTTLIEENSD